MSFDYNNNNVVYEEDPITELDIDDTGAVRCTATWTFLTKEDRDLKYNIIKERLIKLGATIIESDDPNEIKYRYE